CARSPRKAASLSLLRRSRPASIKSFSDGNPTLLSHAYRSRPPRRIFAQQSVTGSEHRGLSTIESSARTDIRRYEHSKSGTALLSRFNRHRDRPRPRLGHITVLGGRIRKSRNAHERGADPDRFPSSTSRGQVGERSLAVDVLATTRQSQRRDAGPNRS